jgi:hypothetical protein
MPTTTTRTDLDILKDALEWVADGIRCSRLDPETLAAELRDMIEKMERGTRCEPT